MGMEILNFFSAVVLWPACFWALVVQLLLALRRRRAFKAGVTHDL